jgi:hypothetical protein
MNRLTFEQAPVTCACLAFGRHFAIVTISTREQIALISALAGTVASKIINERTVTGAMARFTRGGITRVAVEGVGQVVDHVKAHVHAAPVDA